MLYGITLGNHESDWPSEYAPAGTGVSFYTGAESGGECGVPATRQFRTPRGADDAPWWSADIGAMHVVSMSTEHNFTHGSAQHAWLAADLAAVDRARTPWVVFGGHRALLVDSLYSSSHHNGHGDRDVN